MVVLPKAAVEFEDGPVAPIPVALLFAFVTIVTALSANGVPFLNAVLTGEVAALSDPIYYQVAAPGTLATLAILGVPLQALYTTAACSADDASTQWPSSGHGTELPQPSWDWGHRRAVLLTAKWRAND